MTNTGEPGDDDELDDMMGSMRGIRTMFRELPDEDPPSRGLEALMSAARTKAAEMAPEPEKESWWRRTLAMLTRPPMLAAATVIVLVGSTVMLTRRGGLETAAPERTSSRDLEGAPMRDQPAGAGGADRKREGTSTGAGRVEVHGGATKGVKDATEKTDDKLGYGGMPGNTEDRPVRPRPRPPAIARPEPPTEALEAKTARPVVIPADEADPRIITESGEGLRVEQQVPDKAPEAPKPATTDTVAERTASTSASVAQLVKRAELAASRNDCAAVKATAERIRKLDEAAYKTRVVTQAAIKRCL